MPRGPAPGWSRRKEPILDDHLRASMSHAGGQHNEHGHYAELVYVGCATRERAKEIKQALHRAGRYVGVSVSTEIERAADGTWSVRYKAIDKAHAKAYMLEHYGSDPNLWPYRSRGGFPNSSKAAD